jgi:signal transduction histidine kinase
MHNAPPNFQEFSSKAPILKRRIASSVDRAIDTGQAIHILDVATEAPNEPIAKFGGARTLLAVPMLKDNEAIGVLGIYRQEVRPFTDKQIALVQNFAAQAVIAIENTRLLNELRQRTTDLTESLEQQTATSEILSSMSGAMTDTKPVFDTILRNLQRLFGTIFVTVHLLRDAMIHLAALDGEPGFEGLAAHYPLPVDDSTGAGCAILLRRAVQFAPLIDNMSHELRTPLNAILGYTELMADGAYGEPSEKMLGILKRLEANGKHLLGLINDVLDLSKIEAGQLVLELSDTAFRTSPRPSAAHLSH